MRPVCALPKTRRQSSPWWQPCLTALLIETAPAAMPTVLSVTLALGAFTLAKEGAIVSRMSGALLGCPLFPECRWRLARRLDSSCRAC